MKLEKIITLEDSTERRTEKMPGNKEVDSDDIPDAIEADTILTEEYPYEYGNVNSVMEQLQRNPTNWYINFEQFNIEGKKALYPKFKKFFDEEIGKFNNEWCSKLLKPKLFNKLIETLH